MNEDDIRERAQAICDALVTGDVELAVADFSEELKSNLGEVVALLPLPASAATVESVERGASSYNVLLRIVSAAESVELQTRWKERDGNPTVVEASHVSSTAIASAPETDSELPDGGEPQA